MVTSSFSSSAERNPLGSAARAGCQPALRLNKVQDCAARVRGYKAKAVRRARARLAARGCHAATLLTLLSVILHGNSTRQVRFWTAVSGCVCTTNRCVSQRRHARADHCASPPVQLVLDTHRCAPDPESIHDV